MLGRGILQDLFNVDLTRIVRRQPRGEEGREEGRQEGERIALASTLVQLMRLRFRVVPLELSARVDAATKAEAESPFGQQVQRACP